MSLSSLAASPTSIIDDGNMSLVCTALETVEIFDCSTDFPTIPPEFQDLVATNDESVFNSLGGFVNNECNPVVITVQDFNNVPATCDDSLYIQRVYLVSDQNTFERCTTTLVAAKPPLRMLRRADDMIVSCGENVDSIFQDWINQGGFSEVFDCHNAVVTTTPSNPQLDDRNCITSVSPFVTNIIKEKRVQWDYNSPCSKKASTIASFFVIDTIPPTIECPTNMTFNIGDVGLIDDINSHLETASADDICVGAKFFHDFTEDKVQANCDAEYDINVLFTATDSCLNRMNCNMNITIINDQGPEISCPGELMLECGSDMNQGLTNQWMQMVVGFDNVGNPLPPSNNFPDDLLTSALCNHEGEITFTVTDVCGMTAMCNSRIIINDTQPPVITCPDDLDLVSSDPGLLDSLTFWLDSFVGLDDCTDVNRDHDLDLNSILQVCDPLTEIEVNVLFTDECTNEDMCTRIVRITSDYAAVINCAGPLAVQCGDPGNIAVIQSWASQTTVSDNIGNVDIAMSDLDIDNPSLTSCLSPVLVTFTGEDQCGEVLTCSALITTEDNAAPTIICPPAKVIDNSNIDLAVEIQTWMDSANGNDNCSEVKIDNDFNPADFEGCDMTLFSEIIFTATDSCGLSSTCMTSLTVNTIRTPNVECLPNLEIECGDSDNITLINNWIDSTRGFDFTGVELLVNNDFTGNLNQLVCDSMVTVTFDIIDDCLFTDDCSAIIILMDRTPPEIICPTDLSVGTTNLDIETTIENWLQSVQYSDNCLTASITDNYTASLDELCTATSSIVVSFTATDECGLRSDCSSTIVLNTNSPELTCPPNLMLECNDPNNQSMIDGWFLQASAMDNNTSPLAVDNNYNPDDLIGDCTIEASVVFEATDNCGQMSSCIGLINLSDTQGPLVDCPGSLDLLGGDPNMRIKAVEFIENINISDCNSYEVATNLDTTLLEFSCDALTEFPVNVIVTDSCGNASMCDFVIRITNDVQLMINCPDDIVVDCGDADNDQIINDWLLTASAGDNTGLEIPVDNNYTDIVNQADLFICSDRFTITFVMLDDCAGNLTCSSDIVVEDTSIPLISCPNDTSFTQGTPAFDTDIQSWLSLASGTDNCGGVSVDNNYVPIDALDNCEPSVDLTITFTGTDDCSLTADCDAILNIRSDKQPLVNCPQDLVVECGDMNNESLVSGWIDLSEGFDSEGNDLMVSNDYTQSAIELISCDESIEVMFSVTDNCGITENCTAIILMEDNNPPDLVCPADLSINSSESDLDNTLLTWANSYNVSDNCSNPNVTYTDISSIDFCEGPDMTEIMYVAIDECGQESNCSAIVFLDNSAPVLNCTNDLVLECGDDSNNALISGWLLEMSATDNLGTTIVPDNDFSALASILNCEPSITEVTFSVSDNCAKSATCTLNIIVDDSLAPEITCPLDQDVDINSPDLQTLVNNWLNNAQASDQCSSAIPSHGFTSDLDTISCGTIIPVTFTATDECDNSSTCVSNLGFVNTQSVTIDCPADMSVNCGDAGNIIVIETFLEMYEVSADSLMVTNDLDLDNLDINCAAGFTQLITFTAEDMCGNVGTCDANLMFIPTAEFYIPNIFSPNQDGANDTFIVFGNEAISQVVEMSIYNRWGNLVYHAENFPPNDEAYGWDGTWDGAKKQGDTYVYTIIIEDIFGNQYPQHGSLTIVP